MPAIPTQGSDPTKGSGDWLTDECDVIICVEDYKEGGSDGDNFHCLISGYVHAADVQSQIGKKIKDEKFFFLKGQNRVFEFSCALGLYSKPQWEKDVAAGVSPNIPLENCIGMMFATPVRHKKWDEGRDPGYWKGRMNDAPGKFADDPEKMQKEIDKCERILREKKGNIQIGGNSGFTFWAIGDPEADHIHLSPQDLATFPQGLPTKLGTLRKRGTPVQAPAKPAAPASGNGNGSHQPTVNRPALPPAPPAATKGAVAKFF